MEPLFGNLDLDRKSAANRELRGHHCWSLAKRKKTRRHGVASVVAHDARRAVMELFVLPALCAETVHSAVPYAIKITWRPTKAVPPVPIFESFCFPILLSMCNSKTMKVGDEKENDEG